MKILFDAMGAQVQVQQATGDRLTTWFDSLKGLGCDYAISDPVRTLASQLDGVDVYVSLTRQYAQGHSDLQPCTSFSYTQPDLAALQTFVHDRGRSVLTFTNHSYPIGQGPLWPIYEIQLAASMKIQLVFASFAPHGKSPKVPNPCRHQPTPTLCMEPAGGAPAELVKGVRRVEAWDSGGIVPGGGTPIIALPPGEDCVDQSGLEYEPCRHAFAALYTFGAGKVIVVGHSGITGNAGTCAPSAGQIDSADNLVFLNNCITFLGS